MCSLPDVSDIVRALRKNWPLGHCLLFVSVLFLVGCGQTGSASVQFKTPAATPETAEIVLNFFNWDTYMDPQILADFENQRGIAINYQIFENDDQLVTELRKGSVAYDLIVPSDINVEILRREKLLQPLDKANIPNLKNVDPAFLNPPFDPGNRYCIPYQWGTVGVGYNRAALGRSVETWADVFDPAVAEHIALLDDYRTTLGIVLIHLGYSPNSTNQKTMTGTTRRSSWNDCWSDSFIVSSALSGAPATRRSRPCVGGDGCLFLYWYIVNSKKRFDSFLDHRRGRLCRRPLPCELAEIQQRHSFSASKQRSDLIGIGLIERCTVVINVLYFLHKELTYIRNQHFT